MNHPHFPSIPRIWRRCDPTSKMLIPYLLDQNFFSSLDRKKHSFSCIRITFKKMMSVLSQKSSSPTLKFRTANRKLSSNRSMSSPNLKSICCFLTLLSKNADPTNSSFFYCLSLKRLSLSLPSSFKDQNTSDIQSMVQKFRILTSSPNVEEIYFDWNSNSGPFFNRVMLQFSRMNLSSLTLDNIVMSSCIGSVMDPLNKMQKLCKLSIKANSNETDTSSINLVLKNVGQLKDLTHLTLVLYPTYTAASPRLNLLQLTTLTKLTKFTLCIMNGYLLQDEECESLRKISFLRTLQELNLTFNTYLRTPFQKILALSQNLQTVNTKTVKSLRMNIHRHAHSPDNSPVQSSTEITPLPISQLNWSNFSFLETLKLDFYFQGGADTIAIDEVFKDIANITNLLKLSLKILVKNDFSSDKNMKKSLIYMTIFQKLQKLKSLKLHIDDNHFDEVDCTHFQENLKDLPSLECLKLSFESNEINQTGFIKICNTICNLTKLNKLSLNFGTHVSQGYLLQVLFDQLIKSQSFHKLATLKVYCNWYSATNWEVEMVGQMLRSFKMLECIELEFGCVWVDDDGCMKLIDSVSKMSALQCFTLYSQSKPRFTQRSRMYFLSKMQKCVEAVNAVRCFGFGYKAAAAKRRNFSRPLMLYEKGMAKFILAF